MNNLTKMKILPRILGRKSQKGAKLVEYGLIAGLISVTSIGAIYYNGTSVRNVFCVAGNSLGEKVLIPMGMDYETFPGCSPTVAEPTEPEDPVTPVSPTYDPQDPNLVLVFGSPTTDATTASIYLQTVNNVNGLIEWGDGTATTITGPTTYAHTYADSGEYTVNVTGTDLNTIRIEASHDHLREVISFGDMGLTTLQSAFNGTHNLRAIADLPDTVTDLDNIFVGSQSELTDIYDWNTSNVTDMDYAFNNTPNLAADLQYWDVSNVTTLNHTFNGSGLTGNGIGAWDVSNVTRFFHTFDNASNLNTSLNDWDVSSATSFSYMFSDATSFNGNISDWQFTTDPGDNVTFSNMFNNAVAFNQPLNNWNTSRVNTMNSMFENASSFNQPLSNWDVTGPDNTSNGFLDMFQDATSMAQDLTSWCVPNTNVEPSTFRDNAPAEMVSPLWGTCGTPDFTNAIELTYTGGSTPTLKVFDNVIIDWGGYLQSVNGGTYERTLNSGSNQKVRIIGKNGGSISKFEANGPDLISVDSFGDVGLQSLANAFKDANNLSSLAALPTTVTSLSNTFSDADGTLAGVENWDVSNVTTFYRTFHLTDNFNRNIAGWTFGTQQDIPDGIIMTRMFEDSTAFNQPLNGWDTSNVVKFDYMFNDATSFNRPLDNWEVTQITSAFDMTNMFNGALSYSQDLTSWCVDDFTSAPAQFDNNTDGMVAPLWGFCGPPDFVNAVEMVFQPGVEITIRVDGKGVIDWGDGTRTAATNESIVHTLASGSNQTVKIDSVDFDPLTESGTVTSFKAEETSLLQVVSFGDVGLTNLDQTFRFTDNLASLPSTLPDTITSLENTFYHGNGAYAGVENWDVSNVTDFYRMFAYADVFNRDLSNWTFGTYAELGSKISMSNMFRGTDAFNNGGASGINNWDVSNVNDFASMFNAADSFNQSLSGWDVRSANAVGRNAFEYMFNGADVFNQNLTSWCVANAATTPPGFSNGLLTEPNWGVGSCPSPIE